MLKPNVIWIGRGERLVWIIVLIGSVIVIVTYRRILNWIWKVDYNAVWRLYPFQHEGVSNRVAILRLTVEEILRWHGVWIGDSKFYSP